jgi:hypothetical protein
VTFTLLGPEMELRREPENDPAWQDSVVLCWWDLERGIGGYHRIGHRPYAADGPRADLSSAIFTGDRVLKRNETVPLTDQDRLDSGGWGWGAGACTFEFGDAATWTFAHPEVSGQLRIADFHQPVDVYPKSGQLSERITSGHLEAGGRITGGLSFDGIDYAIDGLAFRDHGWGKRHWDEILAHRWVVGTFDPDAVTLAVSVLGSSGQLANFGCVIRGGDVQLARQVDITARILEDGLTHDGGRATIVLDGGETITIDAEPLQKGAIFWMADQFALNDCLCKLSWGDRIGVGNFEVSNNPLGGSARPVAAINGVIDDGLHAV